MKTILVKNIDNPFREPLHLKYCASFICRFKGLMFIHPFENDDGLLLVQQRESRIDSAIHMFFVLTDLAIFWVNSELLVVDKVIAHPWKPMYLPCSPARYILEINPNRIIDINKGDRLDFDYE